MNHASVCTGVGLFELAAFWNGWQNVFTSEIKPYCCRLLEKRYPKTAHYGNFTTKSFRAVARRLHGNRINVLSAGLPCQPFSVAGLKKGQMDERHLGPAFVRLCAAIRPPWAVVENVAGFVKLALDDFTSAMEAQGYACQAFVLPACAVGAPHRRDRVWIVCYNAAYADGFDRRKQWDGASGHRQRARHQPGRRFANLTNAYRQRQLQSKGFIPQVGRRAGNGPKPAGFHQNANGSADGRLQTTGHKSELGHTSATDEIRDAADARRVNGENGIYGAESQRTGQAGKSTNRLAGFGGWSEHWYEVATRICGVDDGDAAGLDRLERGSGYVEYRPTGRYRTQRLEAGGNGLVPHIPYEIYKMISQL